MVAWSFMKQCHCAYFACLLLILTQLPGTLSRAAESLAEESRVTKARQHNLKIIPRLPKPAWINRVDES